MIIITIVIIIIIIIIKLRKINKKTKHFHRKDAILSVGSSYSCILAYYCQNDNQAQTVSNKEFFELSQV